MKVLMLGWEYPPNIAGGLGVACEGLTRAMSSRNIDILFVVPKLLGGEEASHMNLSDSFVAHGAEVTVQVDSVGNSTAISKLQTDFIDVALMPYSRPTALELQSWSVEQLTQLIKGQIHTLEFDDQSDISTGAKYGRNMFEEVARYTSRVIRRYTLADFDVIHAHDWMTYPAAVALQRMTGKPLVCHVHSLDYDRSGPARNWEIGEIEYVGVHAAQAVIAVSEYTKRILEREYHVPSEKIFVVHNGVAPKTPKPKPIRNTEEKTVLFLGRVTLQKGPDYFVKAAAKVIEQMDDVRFVMAGTGDMLPGMIELAHQLGIEKHFHFCGFLNGEEVDSAFADADLYVMPSVSEPFGISALESISFDTPVLMSKQSGVGEVIHHSLKFDFWDVDRLADLIINGLIHEEMRLDMIEMARSELERLRWEAAAQRTEQVYNAVV